MFTSSLGHQLLRYVRVMRLWPDHAWPWWFRNHWQWLWHLRGFNMYIHITLLCIANVCTNHKTWQISGVWLVLSSRHIQRSVCKLQGNQGRRTGSQMRQLPAGKNGLEYYATGDVHLVIINYLHSSAQYLHFPSSEGFSATRGPPLSPWQVSILLFRSRAQSFLSLIFTAKKVSSSLRLSA